MPFLTFETKGYKSAVIQDVPISSMSLGETRLCFLWDWSTWFLLDGENQLFKREINLTSTPLCRKSYIFVLNNIQSCCSYSPSQSFVMFNFVHMDSKAKTEYMIIYKEETKRKHSYSCIGLGNVANRWNPIESSLIAN
ncbi:hypothetical protein L1887_29968 [Cichorium endivia]|nr:hypothetical protein L1887_29968 [Cichorium endivia]